MKLIKSILFFLLIYGGLSAEEIYFDLPERDYSVRELVTRIENDTNYLISLPFIDSQNKRSRLPRQIKMEDLLHWISRYYETQNRLKIHFIKKEKSFLYQKSISISDEEVAKIIETEINLIGKKMFIAGAAASASLQSGTSIHLDLADKAKVNSDYNYRCTLGEFLDEVVIYYKHYNHESISYGLTQEGIYFYSNGAVLNSTLQVELMPKMGLLNRTESLPKKELTARQVSPSPFAKLIPPAVIAELDEKEVDEVFRQIHTIGRIDIHPFLNEEGERFFLKTLVRPHDLDGGFRALLSRIESALEGRKGLLDWKKKILSLDQYVLRPYDQKKAVWELERKWLMQLLKKERRTQLSLGKPKSWLLGWRSEGAIGNALSKVGQSPFTDRSSYGASWSTGFSAIYKTRPSKKWLLDFQAHADMTRSITKSQSDLELGSLAFSVSANKISDIPMLLSFTSYVKTAVESDLFGSKSIQKHTLYMLGEELHWHERVNTFGFDRAISSTDFFLGTNQPTKREARDYYISSPRSYRLLGLVHRMALLNHVNKATHGPKFTLAAIHRESDSVFENGVLYEIGTGYQYTGPRMDASCGVDLSWWRRDLSVKKMTVKMALKYKFNREHGALRLDYEFENSESLDVLSEYRSQTVKMGVEFWW